MQLSKHTVMGLMSSLALLVAGANHVHAATPPAPSSVIIDIKAQFVASVCDITMPNDVPLGAIYQGRRVYQPFSIVVNCPSSVNTFLYAEIISGSLPVGISDAVYMSSTDTTGTPARLSLTSQDGNVINLDGGGKTDEVKGFCKGNASRNCILTPSTFVETDTPYGQASAILRFSISYL